jgi:hypothetical protein
MHQRRKLPLRFVDRLAAVFNLEGMERELLRSLARKELARNAAARDDLEKQVRVLRRALEARRTEAKAEDSISLVLFEVYCALSAAGEKAEAADLGAMLPRLTIAELERALATLAASGLVAQDVGRYTAAKDLVVFTDGADNVRRLETFIRTTLDAARSGVDAWFPRRDVAHLQSMIFNVSESALREILPRLRVAISEIQEDIVRNPGDVLVHFNVQLFPTANSRLGAT